MVFFPSYFVYCTRLHFKLPKIFRNIPSKIFYLAKPIFKFFGSSDHMKINNSREARFFFTYITLSRHQRSKQFIQYCMRLRQTHSAVPCVVRNKAACTRTSLTPAALYPGFLISSHSLCCAVFVITPTVLI